MCCTWQGADRCAPRAHFWKPLQVSAGVMPIYPRPMRRRLAELREWVLASELRIGALALVAAIVLVGALSWDRYWSPDFREGILVEAHGMILDVLVIGIFILWLNLLRDRRERARRYQEEIDDYREWRSDEAAHRIAGGIRRLNALGVSDVTLSRCYVRKADLREAHLRGSPMHKIDLGESRLRGADLTNANLDTAFLGHSDLRNAVFAGAVLKRARLLHVNANNASFEGADLSKADLRHGRFRSTNFRGAVLERTVLTGADLAGADLRGSMGLTSEALLSASNLGYARLDPDIEAAVRAVRPELLDSYRQAQSDGTA